MRVADVPDFGYELALAGAQLADRTADRRFAAWRLDAARGWNRNDGRLFDLYTRMYVPAYGAARVTAAPSIAHPITGR